MKRLALLCLFASPAFAGDVTLTWTNATENTDGSTLDNLSETRVYRAPCTQGVTTTDPYDTVGPTEETLTVTVPAGEWCFAASHVNTDGIESDLSNVAQRTVAPAAPNPPGSLTVQDLVAYSIIQQEDRIVLLPVGTVPPDTACDPNTSVNGHYAVPVATVNWAGTARPVVVFAQCA